MPYLFHTDCWKGLYGKPDCWIRLTSSLKFSRLQAGHQWRSSILENRTKIYDYGCRCL